MTLLYGLCQIKNKISINHRQGNCSFAGKQTKERFPCLNLVQNAQGKLNFLVRFC